MFKYPPMSVVLKNLQIKNFKGFQREQSIAFEKLTILTGENSSGKSSVIHAILGLIQSGEYPYKFSPNGKYINMGDFKEISNKHKANEITLGLTFYHKNLKKELRFKTIWKNSKANYLPTLKFLEFGAEFFLLSVRNIKNKYFLDFSYDPLKDPEYSPEKEKLQKEDLLRSFVSVRGKSSNKKQFEKEFLKEKRYISTMYKKANIKNIEIKDIDNLYEEVRSKMNMNLHYTIDGIMDRIPGEYDKNINAISSFRLHPERTYLVQSKDELKIGKFGEGYLDQIILWEKIKHPKFKELNSIMKRLRLTHSISAHHMEGGRFEVLVTPKQGGIKSSLIDVGFGISQFLPIIIADLQLKNDSTLFVAEPEIHLHPSVQAEFGDYLVEQIDKKGKNYIIETHSEYFLNRIRLAIVNGTLKEKDLAVYYFDNDGNDIITYKLKFGKKGEIEGAPDNFFKTYMMDVMDIALTV